MVKNLPASAGDARGVGSIPRSGRFPGEGSANSLQFPRLENPTEEPGGVQSMGSTKDRTQFNN